MNNEDLYYQPKDRIYVAEDLSFVVGDSPIVLDLTTILIKGCVDGSILCVPGAASGFKVELSFDGTNYSGQFTVNRYESFPLFGLGVKKIRITHNGGDSGYRVIAR